jgi:ABC-2 type transport system permease protein
MGQATGVHAAALLALQGFWAAMLVGLGRVLMARTMGRLEIQGG